MLLTPGVMFSRVIIALPFSTITVLLVPFGRTTVTFPVTFSGTVTTTVVLFTTVVTGNCFSAAVTLNFTSNSVPL